MPISGVTAYANVYTRVRARIGRLLGPEDYTRLSASPDLPYLLALLKETDYGEYLTSAKEGGLSTRHASYEIRRKLSAAYQTIIKSAPEFAKPLLTQTFRFYEVDNLKAVLRGIKIGETWETIRYMLFPMEGFPTLPFEEMVRGGSIEAAIACIKSTVYYPVLSQALERYQTENSLFPLEVALDLQYWQLVWEMVNQLPHGDREIASKLIGLLVDKNNITWAARYRQYHHMSESEIINYTLPFGYKSNDVLIRAIAAGADVSELIVGIYPGMARTLAPQGKAISKLSLIEVELSRMVLANCRSTFISSSFNIGIILAYLFILEYEIQDLTLLIEAKSLGLQANTYTPYLIHQIFVPGRN